MSEAGRFVERLFQRDGSMLCIGGIPAEQLAGQAGTPVFVYDREIMRRSLARLRAALPRRFDVYYSIKANPNRAILRVFLEEGCGLEVASSGELRLALAAGADPRRVLFAGPGKTIEELECAVAAKIAEIHVESADEIEALGAVAARHAVRVGVAIRVNPGEEAQGGAMRMGGRASQFGVDEEILESVIDRVLAAPGLDFRGIHLFIGTQILDHEVLALQYGNGLAIAERAARHAKRPIDTLDLGGGLGIPYYTNDRELDVEAYGRAVHELLETRAAVPALAHAQLLIEPGRHLVGESGVYVCRVIRVKESRGKTFVITDGGMHHHLAASGNLGQVIKRNFPIAVINRLAEPPSLRADVVGPLCTPLDVLGRDVELPAVRPGDLIGVFQSGAYARTASPLEFLSHRTPAEILVTNGRSEIVRRPRLPDDRGTNAEETANDG